MEETMLETFEQFAENAKTKFTALKLNIRTASYLAMLVAAASIANAVDNLPVIGSATTLIGLITVLNFIGKPEFRDTVKQMLLDFDKGVFGSQQD